MKSHFRRTVLSLCVLSQFALASCAPSFDKVQATYVSPLEYQGYSCSQIRQEMMIVARHVCEISDTQDHQANKVRRDGRGTGYFLAGTFLPGEQGSTRGTRPTEGLYEAREEAAVRKNCTVAKEIRAAQKMDTGT